jgi:hypothetical protein
VPRPTPAQETATRPSTLDLSRLPRRMTRREGAELIRAHFFPVSPRTLEVWPLAVTRVNNRALVETAELVAEAQRRLDAAPKIRAGRGAQSAVAGG